MSAAGSRHSWILLFLIGGLPVAILFGPVLLTRQQGLPFVMPRTTTLL